MVINTIMYVTYYANRIEYGVDKSREKNGRGERTKKRTRKKNETFLHLDVRLKWTHNICDIFDLLMCVCARVFFGNAEKQRNE